MSLLETVMALLLFTLTAGSVVGLWTQTSHAISVATTQREVDDVAESVAEAVIAGDMSGMGQTISLENGQTLYVSVDSDGMGGQEVVAQSNDVRQALYISLPPP